MKKRTLSLFIFILLLISCKSISEKSDSCYKNCVIEKTQKKLIEGHGVKKDIFTLLKESELSLLENKIMPDTSNESYLKLAEIAFSDNEASLKTATKIKNVVNNNIFDFLPLCTLEFFSHCPEKVFEKVKDSNEKAKLYKRFMIYAELTSQAYDNEEKIIELINEAKNLSELETQRLTLLNLILMNISNKNH